jgi:7,8-dihydropterin-6-yl-methyl-4-(beta-D-ribofuranosyl)aminobenzene 5'-phosphate synthase
MILDERFLAARVRGRGVSVLSPCSHAGVVNGLSARWARSRASRSTSSSAAIIWQARAWSHRIEPTVHDLANRVRPRVVAPGHCTGWRAKAAFAQAFAPGNYGPSVVGSLYALRAT